MGVRAGGSACIHSLLVPPGIALCWGAWSTRPGRDLAASRPVSTWAQLRPVAAHLRCQEAGRPSPPAARAAGSGAVAPGGGGPIIFFITITRYPYRLHRRLAAPHALRPLRLPGSRARSPPLLYRPLSLKKNEICMIYNI